MALDINKIPWYAQLGIFGGISIIFVVVFYYYFYTDMRDQMKALEDELQTLQSDINKGLVMEAKREEFKLEIERLNQKLDTLKRILPERQEVDDILRKLQGLAAESNLNILRFTPGAENKKEFYIEWPIAIDISGTYHNLAIFFDKIGKFSRIFNINGLVISAVTNPKIDTLTITSQCTASTFIYMESGPPAPAPRPTAPPPRPARTSSENLKEETGQ
ncbi:MAG: type 4a pilus biogenesis protein PilO [Acidobacteria bacterium]|nr:type 4a pilus biogenesis protein PilO [Acidobacteriota bacterium]